MAVNNYILAFISSLLLSYLGSIWIKKIAARHQIVDRPENDPARKIHVRAIPLLGGAAIYGAVAIMIGVFSLFQNRLLGGYLLPKHLIGVLFGGLLIMFGGYLDDRYRLSPGKQIIFPLLASLVIIASGIGVQYITNPFGQAIRLDSIQVVLFSWHGLPYGITVFSDLFALVWLMGMMYTTKFLDGLDGLSTGVGAIGSMIIFFLSLTKTVAQPETALLAIIFAGAGIGFLLMNFNPAKIFLGEGGSVYIGFFLGVLSIISGAKIATALLIMGIPILDTIWVIVRRAFWEHRPIASGDKKHLHFRLLEAGLTHRQAVIFLYVMTAGFGVAGLFFQGRGKMYSLLGLACFMVILASVVVAAYRRKIKNREFECGKKAS